MTKNKTTWARLQMLVIAAVFFGPLAVAAWMYYSGALQPQGRTNHGALLQPMINAVEVLPQSDIGALGDGFWLLIYSDDQVCADGCRKALYTLRQSRKMLGKDMDRLLRVFLRGDSTPDTVFLDDQHAGLITLADDQLSDLLESKRPQGLSAGGYYLMDPLGNLVLYFHPDIEPTNMVEDIKRLLKLSRIG